MSVDLLSATTGAVFAKLAASITLPLAQVRTVVREKTDPPLVVLGDLDSAPLDEKGGDVKLITFDVHSVYRGNLDRGGLLAIMAAVFEALSEQQLDETGGAIFPTTVTWLTEATATSDDGVTFAGVSQFEVYVQPAD